LWQFFAWCPKTGVESRSMTGRGVPRCKNSSY
jgi:hypothetical protein